MTKFPTSSSAPRSWSGHHLRARTGKPDYEKASTADDYIAALKECGVKYRPARREQLTLCQITVITRCGIIITNRRRRRNGEKDEIEPAVRQFFDDGT
ncbi:MAG: hypothetical protein ACLT98_10585 [Eggerthellaceae bacterium]